MSQLSPHLQRLEDEAIHILREVVAEFRRPVMLYSVGKDSSVMLHLARKAFFPAPPPFPFLHIATGWDFRALLEHRDRMAAEYSLDLLVHSNEEAAKRRRQSVRHRDRRIFPPDADRGAEGRARPPRLRCRDRRRPARRGEGARQGTHLLPPQRRPCLGSAQPAARSCGACSIRGWRPATRCASSRCRTGPSSMSGPTSRPRRFPIVPLYLAAERRVVERGGRC